MIYDLNYFIKKFESLSEKEIIVGFLLNKEGYRCANGWCGAYEGGRGYEGTEETAALEEILEPLPLHWKIQNPASTMDGRPMSFVKVSGEYSYSGRAEAINDGIVREYQQPTPKQRILAALRDVKKMQEEKQAKPEEKEVVVKHKITYVVVPESVSEELKKQTEEIILS